VFELGIGGVLQITEIAQGIDLEKDVLALCPKGVTISQHLTMFDPKVLR
jgi:acyl CoA:acetate/3-ketoacid CoA transferase